MSDTRNSRTYTIVVTVLLVLAAILGFVFWQKSKGYKEEKEKEQTERQNLETEKVNIERELDSLANAYAVVRTENENLQGRLTSTAELIAQKENTIRQIKQASAKDIQGLKDQGGRPAENQDRIRNDYQYPEK
ncbi:MAG: hypothetical protein IPK76_17680 [Lewinellaceae bacterium]|nr:hypothetical protein [Lewinellaceae bacterium]